MIMKRFWEWSLVCLLVGLVGCASGDSESQDGRSGGSTARVQLNWFPESEHGGLYQALADGTYESAGLAVEIQPGGRETPIGPELQLERCQFAITNADDVLVFREQGIDVVAVMAAMQNHPRCILVRSDSGVDSFEDFAGKTLQRQAGRAFVEFLRAKGYLEGVNEVPYYGTIAPMVGDPDVMIQAYSCAEPLLAEQQGIEVKTLMLSELGFNPYSSVLVTTGKLIEEQPELVQQMVDATREGWRNYLSDGEAGNQAILAANEHGMTAEALQFGAGVMRDLAMPEGASAESIGQMSDERWQTLHRQLVELELIDPKNVKVDECYTLQFLD
jgi:NitT/TauT family transport system substrate-binding protein